MTHEISEMPITGYLSRLSARPGDTVEAKIAVRDAGPYRARLVRVLSADPNPDGPGVHFEDLSALIDQRRQGRRQSIRMGSWGEAAAPEIGGEGASWTALVMPTLAQQAPRAVLHHEGLRASLTLGVDAGGVEVCLAWEGGSCSVRTDSPLRHDRWHRIWASLDLAAGELAVGFCTPAQLYEPAMNGAVSADVANAVMPSGGVIRIACREPGQTSTAFTGKIEDPAILAGCHGEWPDPEVRLSAFGDALVAGWDFAIGIDTQIITGLGPRGRDGMLHNLPTRGVVGARWSGAEHCWRHAPADYAAIKFHEDDLTDCEWETDFTFTVPDGLKSGSYALHLSCGQGEDWLPFYVLPAKTGPRPRVAFLAPTFTYQAYGNHALGWTTDSLRKRMADWHAYPHTPDDYPIYGRSTYNIHPDRAGVVFASRHRPLLNMRPGYLTFEDKAGSGVRHYPSDSHLIGWLEARGIDFDIVTDDDLDTEGVSLLEPYKVVLTGGHPEYHTAATLDALQAHVRRGGRMCYLGGNGFYWRIGRNANLPGVIEVRRAEGGVRAWAAEPGEYYHALDGQLGGLWKRNRRDPQQVAVTGFSTQGRYESAWFRRTEDSRDPAVSWIFDGVEGETFGDYGLNSGGAAGYELDRADSRLGTPDSAVVVARSEGLQPGFLPLMEDLCFPPNALTGENASVLVRGDMTYFEADNGGSVFAASSISFCGSLWKDGAFQGPVSRILENVVRRLGEC